MANTIVNPPPRVREIVLRTDWNVPTPVEELVELLGEKRDKCECKTCGWTGAAEFIAGNGLLNMSRHPIDSVRRSAEDGCVSCQVLEAVVSALGITSRLVHIWSSPGTPKGPGVEYRVEKGTASLHVDFFIQEWEPALEPPLGFPQRRLLDSSVESSLDWAEQQLAACVLSHPSCRVTNSAASSSGSFLPTRLINLSPLERDAEIFLQNRDTIQPGSRYAALSYTWGTGQPPACITTAETLKARQQGIPWSTVPATFRDAIHVARRLGISYLWIDSICIVQGDKEEWEREGGTMFHVYQNAHVTLAAAAGRGSSAGLWKDPNGHREATLAAWLRLGDVVWPLYIRPRHDEFYDWRQMHYPLFSRAWAYQERLVSPRLLLFMGTEVAYQCFQECDCECGLDAVPPSTSVYTSVVGDKQEFSNRFGGAQDGSHLPGRTDEGLSAAGEDEVEDEAEDTRVFLTRDQVIGDAWRRMVHAYRTMRLSDEGDRLLAIGAIAQHVQASRPGEDYLAGLWSGSLHADLLWGNGWPRSRAWPRTESQPSSPVAPSWSWASRSPLPSDSFQVISEKIAEGMAHGEARAEVLRATCHYTNDNPFGTAPSGELVLRGRLLACRFLNFTTGMILLCGRQTMYLDRLAAYESILHDEARPYVSFGQFYLLELGSANSKIPIYSRPYRLYLMLKRHGRKEKTYVRIGIAQLPEGRGFPKPFVELGRVEVCTLV